MPRYLTTHEHRYSRMVNTTSTEPLLQAVALALVDQPRASLQELAKAIGVSKATLYRFCPTRELLLQRLYDESVCQFGHATTQAQLETGSFRESFRLLVEGHMKHKELFVFLIYNWRPELLEPNNPQSAWLEIQRKIDNFFLRGQKEGLLRVDISATAMSEMFMGMLLSLVDAERMGRVARADVVSNLEALFFDGAKV